MRPRHPVEGKALRPLIVLASISAVMAGCSATTEVESPREAEPLPYRLLVAMPENDPVPEEGEGDASDSFALESDVSSLERSLLQAIRRQGVFQEVSRLPATERGEEGVLHAVREQADFLLETRVLRRVASYVGRNGRFIPNLFLSIFAWPVAWWVKDETYALDLEVEVDLRSWRSGLVMHSSVHQVRVEDDLDDFQRGWMILSLLRVPGALGEENWKSVDRSLAVEAEADVARRVAEVIDKEIRAGVDAPEFQQAFAERYALVIGVSQFRDHGIQNLRFADSDARSFQEYLRGEGRVPPHNTTLLMNDQATLGQIRDALASLFTLGVGEDDEIIIYYAGYGAWREGQAYLLLNDADSDRLAKTSLPLADLWPVSEPTEGPRVTLILDAPFVRRFRGRAASEGADGASLEAALGEFLTPRGNRVLSACRIGEGCMELEDVGGGLYTHYLIEGLEGSGDRNRDGRVTWEEAAAYAGWMVGVHAPLEGKDQQPGYFAATEGPPGPGSKAE